MKKRNLLLLLLLSPNIVFAATEYIDCGKIAIPSPIAPVTRAIILLLQIVLPMGLIILGSLDFVKSTTANEDKIKKHQQRFVKRLISAAVVFMVISIAKIVTNMVSDGGNIATCLDCLTSKKASCGSVTFNPFDPDYPQQQDIYIPGFKQPGLDKDKYDKNENNDTSNPSNPSNPSTPSNYDKFIFSGDSKTVGMCGSKDTTGCNTQDWQGNSLCGDANVSACGGKSYAWFRDNALSQITAKTSGGGYNIILWWGVNDTGNSKTYSSTWAKNYYNQYKNYADTEWKQNNIYVVGISPLRNDTEDFTNAKINSFNNDMKSMINSSGSSNLRFCDISSISFTKDDYVDFVHHSKSGYQKVYNYITNNCIGNSPGALGYGSSDDTCELIKVENKKVVSYEDFKEGNTTDDYYAIKNAHECANKLGLPVEAKKKGIYNIYNTKNEGTIPVETSTNLNGATIYIHDEKSVVNTNAAKTHIFTIKSNNKTSNLNNSQINSIKSKIKKGTSKIPELGGYGNALVEIINNDKKQYIRYGVNANDGKAQTELIKVNNSGTILNDIIWDYNNITNINIYPMPTTTLYFKNGEIVTIADTSVSSGKGYVTRGIKINRSYTEIDNITHKVVNKNNDNIQSINYNYYGFLNIAYTSNVTIKNTNLYALITKNKSPNSTYDLIIEKSNNIIVNNVKIPENQMSGNYWGVTGSNYIKDAKFVNCRLNRIDAHAGAYNLTISNSTIGNRGLTLIGGGKLTIANTTVSGNPNFITLRHDYGSVWDGLVTITNSTFIPPNANDTSLIDFKIEFDGNKIHNFGYDLVLPNVNVNGLKIKKKVKNFSIFDNTKTGKLNGNLLNVNNYTNGEFKYRIPNDIRYSNITSTASKINISKYKKNF